MPAAATGRVGAHYELLRCWRIRRVLYPPGSLHRLTSEGLRILPALGSIHQQHAAVQHKCERCACLALVCACDPCAEPNCDAQQRDLPFSKGLIDGWDFVPAFDLHERTATAEEPGQDGESTVRQSLPAEVAQGCSSWISSRGSLQIRSTYSATSMRARGACECCSLCSEPVQDAHMQIKTLRVPTLHRI